VITIICAGTAYADQVSYSDSISLQSTNWSSSMSIPKFNPTWGILQSIEFSLSGHVEGIAKFESEDNAPATVTMDIQADIELQRPDLSTILITIPLAQTSDNVTAYDGNTDFGGTSGRTYSGLSADQTETTTSPPPASDLVLFTGFGNIILPVDATGTSTGSGAGNLILQFLTSASAEATVTYIYEVPEPATVSLLAFGGLWMLSRKRR
ncbi:MAG: PEP-CTERM sorting domain-containing protein, partial [Planctomycetota bacterium]